MGLKMASAPSVGISRSLVNGVPSNQKRLPMSTIGIDVPGTRSSATCPTTSGSSFVVKNTQPSTSMEYRPPQPVPQKKWQCHICGKNLSSKRSFDEHANVHNQKRPFQCKDCDYAAASQMTLRRHRLRNHTSREDWGYRCPYCTESFMEPASYQQHVQSRHMGRSSTFGCPYEVCSFVSKCVRHFKEHLDKHTINRMPRPGQNYIFREDNMTRFLIDDEYGVGNGRTASVLPIKRSNLQTQQKNIPSVPSGNFTKNNSGEDLMKQPLRMPKPRPLPVVKHEQLYPARPINVAEPDILPADSEWIEAEIEVESVESDKRLPDGQMDIDLD